MPTNIQRIKVHTFFRWTAGYMTSLKTNKTQLIFPSKHPLMTQLKLEWISFKVNMILITCMYKIFGQVQQKFQACYIIRDVSSNFLHFCSRFIITLKVAYFQKVGCSFSIAQISKKIIPKNYPELEILISRQ